jgi:ATP adenylyltransferase
MERLWAPWRLEYLTAEKPAGCIFCQQGNDRDLLILQATPLTLVMLNRYPYTNGHLMVAPRRHLADLAELSDPEMLELFKTVTLCRDVLSQSCTPDGFNIGVNLGKAAGAGVLDHLHLHVVPRWNGDNNFMSVVGDMRVIPESLLDSYDRLLPYFGPAANSREE